MPLSRASVRFAALQVALAAAVGVGLWLSYPGWRLGLISDRVRRQYPDVPQISSADLAGSLASPSGVKPVLLDVRTAQEYDVGHLLESHRISLEQPLSADDLPEDRGRAIVVYCSTGERAAAFARRLQRDGYQSVFVLEGGIVRWANEGRPMTNGRELVTRVHPGDSQTALLLKQAHRGTLPTTP
jgi:rhodanese-related sulfurtransferase